MPALSPAELEVIQLSLKVAFWSVLCSLPLAVATALLLARCRFPGKSLFDAFVHLYCRRWSSVIFCCCC